MQVVLTPLFVMGSGQYAGCADPIPRKDMDRHCQESVQDHLLLMAKSQQELVHKNEELARKNDDLTRKYREVSRKNNKLTQEVEELAKKVDTNKSLRSPFPEEDRFYHKTNDEDHRHPHDEEDEESRSDDEEEDLFFSQ